MWFDGPPTEAARFRYRLGYHTLTLRSSYSESRLQRRSEAMDMSGPNEVCFALVSSRNKPKGRLDKLPVLKNMSISILIAVQKTVMSMVFLAGKIILLHRFYFGNLAHKTT